MVRNIRYFPILKSDSRSGTIKLTNNTGAYDVKVNVKGGGVSGQLKLQG